MFRILYNCALFLYVLSILPKVLWLFCVRGKYKETLRQRLGLDLPDVTVAPGQKVLWIHAISMGETRAVVPLFRLIREHFPSLNIVISSTTETGHAEAKRSMAEANAHFLLPFDFSWIIEKFMKKLTPSYLLLVESDFWYNLLSAAKQQRAAVFLVNGKVSERSARRFHKVPFFTQRLFAQCDLLCVQSELYRQRFLSLHIPQEKLFVTGNIKLDVAPKILSPSEKQRFKEELGITDSDRVIAIGSTHEPEEEWLLSALSTVWEQIPALKVLIIPRHPERFSQVAAHLKQRHIDTLIYSECAHKRGGERVILIDAMGLLNACYQLAEIAIVAGSFVSHVGGHNIFEPVVLRVPVLFGPHMHSQPDLTHLILQAHAGKQITIQELPQILLDWLQHPHTRAQYSRACETLSAQIHGSTQRTFEQLLPYFKGYTEFS